MRILLSLLALLPALYLNQTLAQSAAQPMAESALGLVDPKAMIQQALDQWRSDGSYSEVSMIIHRPDWERRMALRSWSRGRDDALIRFTAPEKDAGNASLRVGQSVWVFTPRLNQVIKLPPSMMSQSWMGSDFSYDDLARSDSVIDDYSHVLVESKTEAGHKVHIIDVIPTESAPTVWGKVRYRLREDLVVLEQTFFDQDDVPVKRMITEKIEQRAGRPFPVVQRMENLEEPERWTQIEMADIHLDVKVPAWMFTQSSLSNPRDWTPK